MADPLEHAVADMSATITHIDTQLGRLAADNKRMRSLLSQAALFVAMQPSNRFRDNWLKEVMELCNV